MAGTDLERIRRKQEELQQETNFTQRKVPYWKPKEGQNQIRILPAFGERQDFYLEYYVSRDVGPNKKTIIPRKANGLDGPDPLQDHIDELRKQQDEVSLRELQRIQPKKTYGLWIIDRADEAKGPQYWTPTPKTFLRVLTIMADPDYGDICSVQPAENGTGARDLKIQFTPGAHTKNGFAEYAMNARPTPQALGTPEQIASWLAEDLFSVYRIAEPTDIEFVSAVLQGKEQEFIAARKGEVVDHGDAEEPTKPQTPPAPVSRSSQPSPPVTIEPKVILPAGYTSDSKLWIAQADNSVVETTAYFVIQQIQNDIDPYVMAYDQVGGWQKASAMGFRIEIPTPPPPMSPPVSPPAPTPPSAPWEDQGQPVSEAEELKRRLAEIQQKKAASPQGPNVQDLLKG